MNDLETLVDQLSLKEQVSLLSGGDVWSLPAIRDKGIGALCVTDGPNGARGGGSLIGGVKSAAFPVGISLGASWDPSLVKAVGVAIAQEVKTKDAHVLLAPTINLQRSVTNGRNFECYSEDPVLTRELAIAYVQGVQSEGVAATAKHFVGNESEFQRTTINSCVSEAVLRENYLLPFEGVVKEANIWALMTSYNKLNGTFTSEHSWLLRTLLRDQWQFDGVVMSDWFGSHTTADTVNAGLDLEMPGPTRDRGQKLVDAVEAGAVEPETVRQCALNVLRLIERTGVMNHFEERHEQAIDRPEHRVLNRRAASAGAVLLKNNGILPLNKPTVKASLAVIGPNSKTAQIMGGGSSQLNPHYSVTPWQGLVNTLDGDTPLIHADGCTNHRYEPLITGELTADFYANDKLEGPVVHSHSMNEAQAFWFPPIADGHVDPASFSVRIRGVFKPTHSGEHRVGLFSAGFARIRIDGELISDAWTDWKPGTTFFEEGCDEVVNSIELDADREYAIEIEFASKPAEHLTFSAFHAGIGRPTSDLDIANAAATAANAETAVVYVGRNGEWDSEGCDLPDIRLPGRQDELVHAVAAANPNCIVVLQTGGPVEMPWLEDVAAVLQAWYPGQEAGNAIADMLFGDAEPGGRLAQTFPKRINDNPTASDDPRVYPGVDGHVEYREGHLIGYRHYDKQGIEPLFPFGFGLGYTTFELDAITVDDSALATDGTITVNTRVKNTGKRYGSTVAQLYVSALAADGSHAASADSPDKTLKAFRKIHADIGETVDVSLTLVARDFARFDAESGMWQVAAGTYQLQLGCSARDILDTAEIVIESSRLIDPGA